MMLIPVGCPTQGRGASGHHGGSYEASLQPSDVSWSLVEVDRWIVVRHGSVLVLSLTTH